jgi:hypothetical protein
MTCVGEKDKRELKKRSCTSHDRPAPRCFVDAKSTRFSRKKKKKKACLARQNSPQGEEFFVLCPFQKGPKIESILGLFEQEEIVIFKQRYVFTLFF